MKKAVIEKCKGPESRILPQTSKGRGNTPGRALLWERGVTKRGRGLALDTSKGQSCKKKEGRVMRGVHRAICPIEETTARARLHNEEGRELTTVRDQGAGRV